MKDETVALAVLGFLLGLGIGSLLLWSWFWSTHTLVFVAVAGVVAFRAQQWAFRLEDRLRRKS